jgi:hypothetical protein
MLHQMDVMTSPDDLQHKDFADMFCSLVEEEDRINDKQR